MRWFLVHMFLMVIPAVTAQQSHDRPQWIACVGNSVTFGYGLQNPSGESYPARLQTMLGEDFLVGNFGRSGATLLSKGHNPYVKSEEYRKALEFLPDIVIIDLGLNDIAFDSLSLQRINALDYFEGSWQSCSPETAREFSAIGYYFGRSLRLKLDVPVGLIVVAVGGAPIESFIDRKPLEFHPVLVDVFPNKSKNDFIFEWVRQRTAKNISLSNNDQRMPFFFAQLSGIDRPSWPHFRDVQRQLAELIPHTALVVTSDIGDSLDVHPVRKREVGERFALQAFEKVYGLAVEGDSPAPLKIIETSESLIITFKSARKLKTSDGKPLHELEVAGQDAIFRPASGVIKRNKLIINEPGQKITAVRYGWKPFSRGNLVNESGLPASTFKIHTK